MLTVHITDETKPAMLRAIRAACNELLGETTPELIVPKAAEQATLAAAFDKAVEAVGAPAVAQALLAEQAEDPLAPTVWAQGLNEPPMGEPPTALETDSTGAEWNPELHASTKTKNSDGTWKKRRNAGSNLAAQAQETAGAVDTVDVSTIQDQPGSDIKVGLGAVPPVPPPVPAALLVTMNDIYALVTSGKKTINDVIALAQDVGFADVGAFSREATPEQRAEMLRKLEG